MWTKWRMWQKKLNFNQLLFIFYTLHVYMQILPLNAFVFYVCRGHKTDIPSTITKATEVQIALSSPNITSAVVGSVTGAVIVALWVVIIVLVRKTRLCCYFCITLRDFVLATRKDAATCKSRVHILKLVCKDGATHDNTKGVFTHDFPGYYLCVIWILCWLRMQ